MTESYSIAGMYHVSFIHSSIDGHLGGFYISAAVSSAAMSIGVRVPFRIVFFSSYMPSSGITVSRVHASVTQTLCDLVDCSLPGSFVHGMVQAWILEWVANFSSRESS